MNDPLMPECLFIYSSLPFMQKSIEDDAERSNGFIIGYRHILFSDFLGLILSSREKILGNLSSMGEHRLLRDVAERECGEDDTFLRTALQFRGSLELLLSMIDTLREACLTADDLRRAMPHMGEQREKFQTLARIMESYGRELQKLNLCDGPAAKSLAIERLGEKAPIDDLDTLREIHFNWIYRISELDFQIILALCKRSSERNPRAPQQVFFHLPYNAFRQDAFRFLNPLVERFESLADTVPNLTLDFADFPEKPGAPSTLSHLHKHLFLSPRELLEAKKIENDGSLQLIKAPGYEAEIHEICREIRLLLEEGVKCSDIIVAFRNLSQYGPMAFEAAQSFSLPFSFPRGNPLLSSHLVRTLLLPFQILRSDFGAGDVSKFLNSLYIDYTHLQGKGDSTLSPGLMHDLIRKAGILDDITAPWEQALQKYLIYLEKDRGERADSPSELQVAARQMIGIIRNLKASLSRLRGPAPVRRFSKVIKTLIREFRIRENSIKNPRGLRESPWPLLSLQRDLSALEGFEKSLRTIERTAHALDIQGAVTMEEFYDMLLEELRGRNLSPPGDRGGIKVLDAFDLMGHSTPYLLLGGLSEGQFPTRHYEHVLFSDDEKAKLNEIFQKKLFLSTPLRHWEENLLFYMALFSCRRKAYLSFSTIDEKGETLIPSYFLQNFLSLIEENPLERASVSPARQNYLHIPSQIVRPQELDGYITLSLWRERAREHQEAALDLLHSLATGRHKGYMAHLAGIMTHCEMERLRESCLLKNFCGPGGNLWGIIEDPGLANELRDRYGDQEYLWSASALEDYGRCPFIFFAKRILHIEPHITPELEVDRLSEGTIVHEILEHFFALLKARKRLPLTGLPSEKEELEETASRVFSEWEQEKATGDADFWTLKKKSILRTLLRWIDFEQRENTRHLIPAFFEAQFGRGSLPFSLMSHQGRRRFTGKIDRIDVSEDGTAFRVIDYKNSRNSADYKRKLHARNLGVINFQIPLYAMAAEELLRKQGIITGENPERSSAYALLKKPDIVPQTFQDPELAHYFSTDLSIQASLKENERSFPLETSLLIERLLSGNLQPRGLECDYCDYGELCRYRAEGTEDDE
jgi:ATP-dependent helicase/DNAse subunit B